jgi:Bifunctional DNA primase/polymerase, N-terminal
VLPIEPRGKRPLVPWRALQSKAASEQAVKAWFRRWPDANVGIVTGHLSGRVVLDVDARHGGADSHAALEQQHGAVPPTFEAVTGGGGRHLYFRHPGSPTLNRVGLRPGIDLRGDGGCIVAPPSVHPSGRSYVWLTPPTSTKVHVATLPQWLRSA